MTDQKDNLMIVAHPDDEVLFGGAQLLTSSWTVLCVTNGDNPVRRHEFESVMNFLDYPFEMWDFPDKEFELLPNPIEAKLKRFIESKSWNKVLTHNQYGEYGHLHHRQLNSLVKKFVKSPYLWHFNYHKNKVLESSLWEKKLELMVFYESQAEIVKFFLENRKQETAGYSQFNIRNEIISKELY
jgi:hypothetical protein